MLEHLSTISMSPNACTIYCPANFIQVYASVDKLILQEYKTIAFRVFRSFRSLPPLASDSYRDGTSFCGAQSRTLVGRPVSYQVMVLYAMHSYPRYIFLLPYHAPPLAPWVEQVSLLSAWNSHTMTSPAPSHWDSIRTCDCRPCTLVQHKLLNETANG